MSSELFREWDLYDRVTRANHMRHEEIEAGIRAALARRSGPVRVLDLGCGDGRVAEAVLGANRVSEYVGVDLSAGALGRLGGRPGPGLQPDEVSRRVVCGDIAEAVAALPNGAFEVVLAGFSLHHFPTEGKAGVLGGIARVLAAGGWFIWTDTVRDEGESREAFLGRLFEEIRTHWVAASPVEREQFVDHIREFDHPESWSWMTSRLESRGLAPAEILYRDEFYVSLLARKSAPARPALGWRRAAAWRILPGTPPPRNPPMPLPPLRFEPIFKENLWGGRRLPGFLRRPPPFDGAIGEVWVLSDVDGSPSRVADGPHTSATLRELLAADPVAVLGTAKLVNGRFPLLLKFIDARQELSVQVHPDDARAAAAVPGANGKTEAWYVVEANPATSRIYAGFRPGVTAADFRAALATKTTPRTLHSYTPNPGDCVFLEAGTVHAIGADILMFEVQQTCDITYRLYDWDRVDAKTGEPRELHVEAGLACADFARGPCPPVTPVRTGNRERLVACPYFTFDRRTGSDPFRVGMAGACRAVVCVGGAGELACGGARLPLTVGDVVLIPASAGEATCHPAGGITLLECGLPTESAR